MKSSKSAKCRNSRISRPMSRRPRRDSPTCRPRSGSARASSRRLPAAAGDGGEAGGLSKSAARAMLADVTLGQPRIDQGTQRIAVDADIRQITIAQALEFPERGIAVAPVAQPRGEPPEAPAEHQQGAQMT